MEIERKYGDATTIIFPLLDRGAIDFEATPVTFAAGDCQIMKDEGAFANTTNLPAHEGNGWYSLALTATEMQAARIGINIVDQTATKLWEDQGVIISTYGHVSAQHALDRDAAINVSSGIVEADIIKLKGDSDAALALGLWSEADKGLIDAGSTSTTVVLKTGHELTDDFYNGMIFLHASAPVPEFRRIVDYDQASATLTLDRALDDVPADNDVWIVMGHYNDLDTTFERMLKHDWTGITGEASRSFLNALRFLRNRWTISGGTLSVKKEDDAAEAWNGAVTTAAGDPVSEIDPT